MELRYKVVLLGVVPLVVAAGLLAVVVEREGTALVDSQIAEVAPVLRKAKEDQLIKVVELALKAVPELSDPARNPGQALAKLRGLRFGEADDGYFYVYDMATTTCLMNAQSPHLEGKNQTELRDDRGRLVMPPLFEQAHSKLGRGFVAYRWQKPSQHNGWRAKLGYVVALPGNWMVGTGVYIDDLEATTAQLRESSAAAIRQTMISIAVIAVLAMLLVAAVGLVLNVSQQRLADSKLQRLTRQVVTVQEAERARVSRYLHDEAVQDLIAVKCVLETAVIKLRSHPLAGALTETLEKGVAGLAEGVDKIRLISREVRTPVHGDDLAMLLAQIGAAFAERTQVVVSIDGAADPELSAEAATALFRVAQQALDNIERHARATHATIALSTGGHRQSAGTRLSVCDDGRGFDVAAVRRRRRAGIGLLSMQERIEGLGGWVTIRSSGSGTEVEAFLPEKVIVEEGHHDDIDA